LNFLLPWKVGRMKYGIRRMSEYYLRPAASMKAQCLFALKNLHKDNDISRTEQTKTASSRRLKNWME